MRRQDDGAIVGYATWLETFYDLVFAVAVSSLGDLLARDTSPLGVLRFAALFVPLWWIWVGQIVFATRFDMDNLLHRLYAFTQMLAVAAMAVQIPAIVSDGSVGFAAAYVVARLTLLALYVNARRDVPQARSVTSVYLVGFGLGAALWAVSIVVPPPLRYGLWGLGMAIDLATPWLGRPALEKFPVDASHLPDRFGGFLIIILGVSILSVVSGVSDQHWRLVSSLAAVAAFVLAVCVWWLYFAFYNVAQRGGLEHHLRGGAPYIYAHLPIVIGLAVISVSIRQVIVEAGKQAEILANTLWLLGGGSALWALGFLLIHLIVLRRRSRLPLLGAYGGAALAAALCTALSAHAPPLLVIAAFTAIFLLLVLFEMRYVARPVASS